MINILDNNNYLDQTKSTENPFSNSKSHMLKENLFRTACIIKKLTVDIQDNLRTLAESAFSNTILPGPKIIKIFLLDQQVQNLSKFQGFLDFMETKEISNNTFLENFLKILVFLLKLKNTNEQALEDYKICLSREQSLKFMCMNAALSFKDFLKNEQSITILTSGTLKPFKIIEGQLDTDFEKKLSTTLEIEKWRKQLMAFKMRNLLDLHYKDLKFTYEVRDDPKLLGKCLRFLGQICTSTKEGVLIFLPSYKMLDNYKAKLETLGSDETIKEKDIYFEDKENSNYIFKEFSVRLLYF